MTSHGPTWVRLLRPDTLAQPGVRRGVRLETGRTRALAGVGTTPGLVLDSAGPPAGPLAPRLSL